MDFPPSIFVHNDYSVDAISKGHNNQSQFPFWHIHTEPGEDQSLSSPRNFARQIFESELIVVIFKRRSFSSQYSFQSPTWLLLKIIRLLYPTCLILIKLLPQFFDVASVPWFSCISGPQHELLASSQGDHPTLGVILETFLSPAQLPYISFQVNWLPCFSP